MNFNIKNKEQQIRGYLENLLIELEVSKSRGIMDKIVYTVNYYGDKYPELVEEYANKGNEILRK